MNVEKPSVDDVAVGHDLLQLLTSAMYTDPMILYREYTQNAVDAIDLAISTGGLERGGGQVLVDVDPLSRIIRIRDNGAGLSNEEFFARLSSIGASVKRQNPFRGFRGIGRLVGLAYCRALIFRSRSNKDEPVLVGHWDCQRLRDLLASKKPLDITDVVRQVFTVGTEAAPTDRAPWPDRFFEVELCQVVRLGDDRLVNATAVKSFLSQVAPVPFAPGFTLGPAIVDRLNRHFDIPTVEILVNGSTTPLFRPFRDHVSVTRQRSTSMTEIEFIQVQAYDDGLAAFGWIAHHDYIGALPLDAGVRGIRARHGNLQIGDESILDSAFVEPRFNKWCIGELHVFDSRLIPNGRRDAFEPSLHLDNLTGQLLPITRRISKICRTLSAERNRGKSLDRLVSSLRDQVGTLESRIGSRVAKLMLTKLELSEPSSGASDVSSNKEFQRIRKRLANSASRSVRLNEREKGRLDAIAAMLAIDVNTADVLRVVRELEAI